MSYEVVDFRKPGRVSEDIERMFLQWQSRSREAAELRWGACLLSPVKFSATPPAALTGEALRALDDSWLSYRVDMVETGEPTLLLVQRPLALALISEMLGEALEEFPEDRGLTAIEYVCLDYLIDELMSVLQNNQRLDPSRSIAPKGEVRLKELHKQFPPHVTNTSVDFQIELAAGTGSVRWVIPQAVTLDMVAASSFDDEPDKATRQQIEALMLGAQSHVSLKLGTAVINLQRLAALKPGDVIVLDQRIDEPLEATMGGQPMFRGWGARIGPHQAFQIDELTDI